MEKGANPEPLSHYPDALVNIIDVDFLHLLVQHGFPIDAHTEYGSTLLHELLNYLHFIEFFAELPAHLVQERRQNIEATILEMLRLDPSPDTSLQNKYGDTLLHRISSGIFTPFRFQLFDRLATPDNINIANNNGHTPLMEYIRTRQWMFEGDRIGFQQVLDQFEAKGANFLVRSNTNQPKGLLELARQTQQPELLRIVQEKVRRAQEQAQGAVVQRGRQGERHRVPPGIARRITDFLGGKRKTRKGQKGRKSHRRNTYA